MKNKHTDSIHHKAVAHGHASDSKEELNKASETTFARGFAAMDEEKRRQIAKRGGSVSRRNRTGNQEPIVIL